MNGRRTGDLGRRFVAVRHLDRIGDKTGLRRRSELTRLALELGLADRPSQRP